MELLVVIGIIALLISILLPALSKARESANRTKCLSNIRQLAIAIVAYTQDNKGWFPSLAVSEDPANHSLQSDWIWWRQDKDYDGKPEYDHVGEHGVGPYLNLSKNPKLLLCPSDPDPAANHARKNPVYPYSYAMNNLMTSEYQYWRSKNPPVTNTGPFGNIPGYAATIIAAKITQVREAAQKIDIFEEADSTIDDGNGSMYCIPGATGFYNLVAARHDRNNIKDPKAELTPPNAGTLPPNPEARGVVGFCDGHAEAIPRYLSHTKAYCIPDQNRVPPAVYASWP